MINFGAGIAPGEADVGITNMKIGLLTDLTNWTEQKLLRDLRTQFSYSLGIALILFVMALGMTIAPESERHRDTTILSIAMFGALELCAWGSFVRSWRELRRRLEKK